MSDPDFPVPPSYDSDGMLVERLRQLFIEKGQASRIAFGQVPAERAVFRKLHGVARGRFEVLDSTPEERRLGIFSRSHVDAWVRFSSDASPMSADLGNNPGVGVKLFGVEDSGLSDSSSDAADLILQNHPDFIMDDLQEMADFTYAGAVRLGM